MSWLVLNTGSSSLKFGLFPPDASRALAQGAIHWVGSDASISFQVGSGPKNDTKATLDNPGAAANLAIRTVLDAMGQLDQIKGVGHRIVHGGTRFQESVRITEEVKADIHALTPLAPLHNPPALAGLDAATQALPNAPQVAVFDTTFFRSLPKSSVTLPVPQKWTEEWGIRRFGFHGISHEFCTHRAAEILERPASDLRMVVCHLGNGCSASAVRGGQPVDTSMSFTPLDGLMMGTRSGSVDPGVLLYLLKEGKIDRDGLDDALNHGSGLLGVSGASSDYRAVEASAERGDEACRLALDIYAGRIRGTIGAMAATLSGLDALIFAGGIGENSDSLRARVCLGLEFIGIHLDPTKNQSKPVDAEIATTSSPVRIVVVHTEEEWAIAQEVRRLLDQD